MKIQIYYPGNSFEFDWSDGFLGFGYEYISDWNDPFLTIYDLISGGHDIRQIKKTEDSYVVVNGNGKAIVYEGFGSKTFKNAKAAILSIVKKDGKNFESGKMYRFIYDGGTRKGQKRAVKVESSHATYIKAVDLDTGDCRTYSLDKIKNAEEIV